MTYHVDRNFEMGWLIKLNRAKKHLHDLYGETDAFFAESPYAIAAEFNSDKSQYIGKLQVLKEAPIARWAGIAGDVVHNLRSALDHMAGGLVQANGDKISRQTAFPIGETLHKYKSVRGKSVKGMGDRAIRFIDYMKPYLTGGNALYWRLHFLDIFDKHQLLLPTLIAPVGGKIIQPMIGNEQIPFVGEAELNLPIINGAAIYTLDIPPHLRNREVSLTFELTWELRLWGPEIVQGMTLRETFNPLVTLVEKTTRILSKLL